MLHIKHSWNNYQIGRWYIWYGLRCVDDFGRTVWNECNHCSAGPCGKGNVTGWADWPSRVVWVQYTLSRPVRNGYNHTFSRRWLAHVDWTIVKSGGPCGTGSSTERAGIWHWASLRAYNDSLQSNTDFKCALEGSSGASYAQQHLSVRFGAAESAVLPDSVLPNLTLNITACI